MSYLPTPSRKSKGYRYAGRCVLALLALLAAGAAHAQTFTITDGPKTINETDANITAAYTITRNGAELTSAASPVVEGSASAYTITYTAGKTTGASAITRHADADQHSATVEIIDCTAARTLTLTRYSNRNRISVTTGGIVIESSTGTDKGLYYTIGLKSGDITINAGESGGDIAIAITEDALNESVETFSITVAATGTTDTPTNANSGSITIPAAARTKSA